MISCSKQQGGGVTVSETDGAFFFDGKGEDAALVFSWVQLLQSQMLGGIK